MNVCMIIIGKIDYRLEYAIYYIYTSCVCIHVVPSSGAALKTPCMNFLTSDDIIKVMGFNGYPVTLRPLAM